MSSQQEINDQLHFLGHLSDGVIAYVIKGNFLNTKFEEILLVFNGTPKSQKINIPEGIWVPLQEDYLTTQKPLQNLIEVEAFSSVILIGK